MCVCVCVCLCVPTRPLAHTGIRRLLVSDKVALKHLVAEGEKCGKLSVQRHQQLVSASVRHLVVGEEALSYVYFFIFIFSSFLRPPDILSSEKRPYHMYVFF